MLRCKWNEQTASVIANKYLSQLTCQPLRCNYSMNLIAKNLPSYSFLLRECDWERRTHKVNNPWMFQFIISSLALINALRFSEATNNFEYLV